MPQTAEGRVTHLRIVASSTLVRDSAGSAAGTGMPTAGAAGISTAREKEPASEESKTAGQELSPGGMNCQACMCRAERLVPNLHD